MCSTMTRRGLPSTITIYDKSHTLTIVAASPQMAVSVEQDYLYFNLFLRLSNKSDVVLKKAYWTATDRQKRAPAFCRPEPELKTLP